MIKIVICGNLTADPVLNVREWVDKKNNRKEQANVCTFTVAADDGFGSSKTVSYFRVTVWREFAEVCFQSLKKGYQVLVHGSVSLNEYSGNDGKNHACMVIRPDCVQFLNNKVTDITMTQVEKPVTTRYPITNEDGSMYTGDLPF